MKRLLCIKIWVCVVSHRTFKRIWELMGLKVQGAHKFYNKISVDEKNKILEEFDRWMRKQVKETEGRKARRNRKR